MNGLAPLSNTISHNFFKLTYTPGEARLTRHMWPLGDVSPYAKSWDLGVYIPTGPEDRPPSGAAVFDGIQPFALLCEM